MGSGFAVGYGASVCLIGESPRKRPFCAEYVFTDTTSKGLRDWSIAQEGIRVRRLSCADAAASARTRCLEAVGVVLAEVESVNGERDGRRQQPRPSHERPPEQLPETPSLPAYYPEPDNGAAEREQVPL
jgi:hypothetical protein